MSNLDKLWKQLNEDRVDEEFINSIPKEFKDSINKTVDKLKDISDGISKSIAYLNRMKRDLTGGESINDVDDKISKIIDNLSDYTNLDFGSVISLNEDGDKKLESYLGG